MARNLFGLFALLLCLLACADEKPASSRSSSDPPTATPVLTADEKRAVAGLEKAFLSSGDTLEVPNATCLATGYVDRLGIEWLQGHEMLRKDLSGKQTSPRRVLTRRDAAGYFDVWFSCVDYKSIVASMVGGEGVPTTDPHVVRCVNAVTEKDVKEAFAAAASDQDFHSTPFAQKLEAQHCGYEGD